VALGVVRDLRSPRSLDAPGEAAAYQEHLMAEYVLARLAHGVTDGTIRGEITAVEQFLAHAGVFAWRSSPRTPTGSSVRRSGTRRRRPAAARPG
jgi:integrase/recombinase XerD